MKNRKKILFVHPGEQDHPSGGGNVAAWLLEGLREDYEITILTWKPFDFREINRYYGTSLCDDEFETLVPPALLRYLIDLIPRDPWKFQRLSLLMRFCKIIGHHYDILMSSCNEIDFGRRGIQYVHYPYLREIWEKEPNGVLLQGMTGYLLKWINSRIRPWRIVSGFSFERMRENLSIVNSEWTGRVFEEVYNSKHITVYPPVPGHFTDIPWTQKEEGFVCVGRLSGEKRWEEIIDIIGEVRKSFPELHLHIIGSAVNYQKQYYRRLKRKVGENSGWVFLSEDLSRTELVEEICRHKYGIHARPDEHFGISVAEMVRGGCIVFVPDDGGQTEIVGNDKRLLFHTQKDALDRILFVLKNPDEQRSLSRQLASKRTFFTPKKFVAEIRQIIDGFVRGLF